MKGKLVVLSVVTVISAVLILLLLSYFTGEYFRASQQLSYEKASEDVNLLKSDRDNDGLSDTDENYIYSTDITNPDTDGDGMPDGWEIRYRIYNNITFTWSLEPTNSSDALDDFDKDGLTNFEEYIHGIDPLNPDTDEDGMPDGWEVYYGLNPNNASDKDEDFDNDGLSNYEEYLYGTNPASKDTDNDELLEWNEIYQYGTDPANWDTDGDGMGDGWEIKYGLNPKNSTDAGYDLDDDGLINLEECRSGAHPNIWDTEGDGIPDGWEVKYNLNPLINDADSDLDNDGLTNYEEYIHNTNPNDSDTDGDKLTDYDEVICYHTNPRNIDTDSDDITDYDELNMYFNNSIVDWDKDGKIDNCTNPNDPDSDGDGLNDYDEIFIYKTNPLNNDFDLDGLKDGDEIFKYGTDPTDPDSDDDSLIDGEEVNPRRYDENGTLHYQESTNPMNQDTDGDSMPDGWEYNNGVWLGDRWSLDPSNPTDKYEDPDGDALENYKEYFWDTKPHDPDTDSDGMPDGWEVKYTKWDAGSGKYNINPKIHDAFEDADNDTVCNLKEFLYNTHPNEKDTDGDGIPDWWEIYYGDHDKDGLPNWFEERYGLPANWSSYWNVITGWKKFEGFSPWNTDTNGNNISDADEDPDGDEYTNIEEHQEHTDPTDPESYPKDIWVNENNIDFIVEKTLYKMYRRDKNDKMGI